MTTLPQLELLTHSRMDCYKACPRKHRNRYELGIRPIGDAKPLRIGRAVHRGIETYEKTPAHHLIAREEECRNLAIQEATKDYEVLPDWCNTDEKMTAWMVERETVAALLSGYFWYWSEWKLEIIQTEFPFELPILNPDTGKKTTSFNKAGKIDGIVRLADGRIAVRETKTCSDPIHNDPDEPGEPDYWRRLKIDQQISHYMVAAREMGYAVETILYDVIRKPTIEPLSIPLLDESGTKIVLDSQGNRCFKSKLKKDGTPGAGHGEPYESGNAEKGWTLQSRKQTPQEYGERLLKGIEERPEFYYQRREIPRLEADLKEFEVELWQIQQQIRESQKTGRWFRNTSACNQAGRQCEYFGVCTDNVDLTTTIPHGFEVVSEKHPELRS